MGWLIFGALILAAALNPFLWSLFKINDDGDNNWLAVIRAIMTGIGVIFVAFNFPDIIKGVSNPGWFVGGILVLVFSVGTYFWKQLAPLWEMSDGKVDDDYFLPWHIVRAIALAVAILMISIGVGTGKPGWEPGYIEPAKPAVTTIVDPRT